MVVKIALLGLFLYSMSFLASEMAPESRAVHFEDEKNELDTVSQKATPEQSYIRRSPRSEVTSQHVINVLFGKEQYEPPKSIMETLAITINWADESTVQALSSSNRIEQEQAAEKIFVAGLHEFYETTQLIKGNNESLLKKYRTIVNKDVKKNRCKMLGALVATLVCWGLVPLSNYLVHEYL